MSGQRLCSVRMAAAAHMQGNKSDEESIDGSSDEEAPQPGEVRMGKFGTSKGAKIYTTGLATCVRVAVTGRYPNGGFEGDDRFLAHIAESKHKAALQGLIDALERAKGNGLQVREVVVVILAGGGSPDSELDEFNEEVIDKIRNATGMEPTVVEHTGTYKMSIEADKRIDYAADNAAE
ncbi:uncharacterized protein FPRO_02288 [Fusarium proliferatum ET1]|uniref:Uncharacterized protein n=1 Tax=Fusarium proliferatum (strain ET1) TaxID=1227346 RepID=A0A1L7VB19_FUSPR|nr:uncharacterized protein FPRO_02288 [Fusarium proliferatum ET1]CZR37452.1 uncharacterized protein FPRO_02288 [Fusarium proliferatum ET1]